MTRRLVFGSISLHYRDASRGEDELTHVSFQCGNGQPEMVWVGDILQFAVNGVVDVQTSGPGIPTGGT